MKFKLILADPPWSYDKKVGQGIADDVYDTMPLQAIKDLPIGELAEENSVLLLWATFPMLQEAFEVLKAWGFTYKTVAFNWIKQNCDGTPFFGIGHYTKSNAEICLLAVKGKGLPVLDNRISQIVMSQRQEHSRKPARIYRLIERLYGQEATRIELFARERRIGWEAWGNEVPKEMQVTL